MDQCIYDQQYLPLYNDNGNGLTQQQAQLLCQQTYNSDLATIDTTITHLLSISDQFDIMRDFCESSGPNQACWTSAKRDTNNQTQFIFNNNFTISINEYFFAPNEGYGNNEDCIALYHVKDYYMSDWPCNDQNGVKIALCNNPKYDPNNECLCKCNKCTVYGDPHIYTFDDLFYHSIAGDCTYHYITPCFDNNYNENMPIDIFAKHSICNDKLSRCIESIYIQLFDKNGNENMIFKFENTQIQPQNSNNLVWSTNVSMKRNGIDNDWNMNDITMNEIIKYLPNEQQETWSYLLRRDNILQIFELRIWTHTEIESINIIIRDISGSQYLQDSYFEISGFLCFWCFYVFAI